MPGRLSSVVMIHSSDEMYGADFMLLQTATALRAAGTAVRVIVPSDVEGERPLSRQLEALGCAVEQHPLGVLRRRYLSPVLLPGFAVKWMAEVWRLRKLLRRERPDLVYSNTLAVTAGAAAAHWCGIPHVWHVHEILLEPRWLGVGLAALARRLATRVITVSEAVAGHLRASSEGLRPVVVHNGIPDPMAGVDRAAAAARVERELGIPPGAPLVLFVGRLSDWKGPQVFAEVARRHIAAGGRAHFALVGGTVPGETHVRGELVALARAPATRGALHWVDFTPDVAPYLARASVFVLPSVRPDPFPTVAIEAMWAALPIVTFAHGGVLEMIRPAQAGVEAPVGDVDALTEAVDRLLADTDAAVAMGRRGRARAESAFGAERFAEEIVRTLEAAVGGAA